MTESTHCPHCTHAWDMHQPRCTQCGCYWSLPKPPPPTPTLTARGLLIAKVRDAIFDELDRQHESSEIGSAGYWDRDWGCIDGEPDWNGVAEAAIEAMEGDDE